ncbi:MAG TPA: hypothetical protein PLK34_02355 [Candidatus Pacearchaeota archaeon]|nr:hypothetical protein [Candidatus Pacearchaeota archaeon]
MSPIIISDFEGMTEGDFYTAITDFRSYEPVPRENCHDIWAYHQIHPRFKTLIGQEDALGFAKEFKTYIQQVNPKRYENYYRICFENLEDAYNKENSKDVVNALECLVASIKFKN